MPLFYKVTAFWGGLDGSLLFWVVLLSIFSAMAIRQNYQRHRSMIAHVVWILAAINLFFIGLLIFLKNPFEPFVLDPQLAGDPRGLNPLLQNIYMVIIGSGLLVAGDGGKNESTFKSNRTSVGGLRH